MKDIFNGWRIDWRASITSTVVINLVILTVIYFFIGINISIGVTDADDDIVYSKPAKSILFAKML